MARVIPESRYQDLIEAATAVFLGQGYRRTQMADVASRMGVAKGTLYLYVESKEALFDAVLRHADRAEAIGLPETLPIPTPAAGATLAWVRKRVAEEGDLPLLRAAIERKRVRDVSRELEGVLRETYRQLSLNRVALKLVDRAAHDHPELAAVFYGVARIGAHALLTRYLEERIRRGHFLPVSDVAVTARFVLETITFWSVHRFWDPAPQTVDDEVAERTVIESLMRALIGSA